MDLSGQCEQGKSGDLPDREHIAMMRSGRDVLCCWLIWDGGRSECIGQLLHSWRSASDSKSTATCRPSSDPRHILLKWPAGLWHGGLLLGSARSDPSRWASPSTVARVEGLLSTRHLPGSANTLEAAKVKRPFRYTQPQVDDRSVTFAEFQGARRDLAGSAFRLSAV